MGAKSAAEITETDEIMAKRYGRMMRLFAKL